jgi:hypothetical protein
MSSLLNSVSVEIEAFIELKLTHDALSPRMHWSHTLRSWLQDAVDHRALVDRFQTD